MTEGELREFLVTLEQVATRSDSPAQYDDALNRTTVEAVAPLSTLPAESARAFAVGMNNVRARIARGGWNLTLSVAAGTVDVAADGDWEDAFDDLVDAQRAEDAYRANRHEILWELLGDVPATWRLTVATSFDGSPFTWMRTLDALQHTLRSSGWIPLVSALTTGERDLIVAELGPSAPISLAHGDIRGLGAPRSTAGEPHDRLEAYRSTWLDDWRAQTVTPPDLVPIRIDGLVEIAALFRSMAACLALAWLGDEVELKDGRLEIRASPLGSPTVEVEPDSLSDADAEAAMRLWSFAVEAPDAVRRDAVQKAIGLTFSPGRSLSQWADDARKLARSLLNVAKSGLTAEALAARRAARDSAMAAGRHAADNVREAVRKAAERIIIQLTAGVGLIWAFRAQVVQPELAFALGALLLLLVGAVSVVTLLVDLPMSDTQLRAFLDDLEGQFVEGVSEDDLDKIKGMTTIVSANATIARARRWFLVLAIVSTVAAVTLFSLRSRADAGEPVEERSEVPASEADADPVALRVYNG